MRRGRVREVRAAALRQDPARVVRCGDIESELLQNPANLADLLGIAAGEFAASDIERILEPDTHIAAHHRSLGDQWHLMAARGEELA